MNEIVPARNIKDYVPLVDGPEKVSGRAKYTADIIVPGMLAGFVELARRGERDARRVLREAGAG